MNSQVAHVPAREPDEVLSSILLRLARNHSASAHEFCVLLWEGIEFWTRDVDRTASNELISAVSAATGIEWCEVERATLRGLIQALGYKFQERGCQRGILPIGVYHRIRRRFGQQYCAQCLSGPPAYLRRHWRLEFMVACPTHWAVLLDSCPQCDAPFVPHRNYSLIRCQCHSCGMSLCDEVPKKPDAHAMTLQERILTALNSTNHVTLQVSGKVLSDQHRVTLEVIENTRFIDGVRRLCRVASRRSRNDVHSEDAGKREWNRLRTMDRLAVMARVGRWIEDWPHAWIEWASAEDFDQHFLTSSYGPWPDWISWTFTMLPYSHGPVGIKRRRQKINLRKLRKAHGNKAEYREARADLLLTKAGKIRGNKR